MQKLLERRVGPTILLHRSTRPRATQRHGQIVGEDDFVPTTLLEWQRNLRLHMQAKQHPRHKGEERVVHLPAFRHGTPATGRRPCLRALSVHTTDTTAIQTDVGVAQDHHLAPPVHPLAIIWSHPRQEEHIRQHVHRPPQGIPMGTVSSRIPAQPVVVIPTRHLAPSSFQGSTEVCHLMSLLMNGREESRRAAIPAMHSAPYRERWVLSSTPSG